MRTRVNRLLLAAAVAAGLVGLGQKTLWAGPVIGKLDKPAKLNKMYVPKGNWGNGGVTYTPTPPGTPGASGGVANAPPITTNPVANAPATTADGKIIPNGPVPVKKHPLSSNVKNFKHAWPKPGNQPDGHHGPDGWGYGGGWGPQWAAPSPIVVNTYYADGDGGAAVAAQDVLPANPAPVAATPAVNVAILNPRRNGTALGFRVDGQTGTLASGQRLDLAIAQGKVIEFDRGGSFGAGSYSLEEGCYTFTPTDHGWELFQTPYIAPNAR